MNNKKSIVLSIIAASTFSLSALAATTTNQHQHMNQNKNLKPNQMVRCMGLQSCQGVKNCTDPCKGVKACKEKGYMVTTKATCDKVRVPKANQSVQQQEQQQQQTQKLQQPTTKHY